MAGHLKKVIIGQLKKLTFSLRFGLLYTGGRNKQVCRPAQVVDKTGARNKHVAGRTSQLFAFFFFFCLSTIYSSLFLVYHLLHFFFIFHASLSPRDLSMFQRSNFDLSLLDQQYSTFTKRKRSHEKTPEIINLFFETKK